MKLSDELERAKQELAEVEAQVLRLEKEEKQDAAATTIQSGARMRRAKLEVERQKLAMIQQQQEVERREQELNAHTETMKGKEAARDEYRQKRLSEQQDRREALLNKKMAERKGNLMRGGATVGFISCISCPWVAFCQGLLLFVRGYYFLSGTTQLCTVCQGHIYKYLTVNSTHLSRSFRSLQGGAVVVGRDPDQPVEHR